MRLLLLVSAAVLLGSQSCVCLTAASGACCIGTQCIAEDVDHFTCTNVYTGAFAGDNRDCSACAAHVPCCVKQVCVTDTHTPSECGALAGLAVHACHNNECIFFEHEMPTIATTTTTTTVATTTATTIAMGACCTGSVSGCVLTAESQCLASYGAAGTFLGVGTHCESSTCRGACCFGTRCIDNALQGDCKQSDGNFLGMSSSCAALGTAACGGACCSQDGKTCSHAVSLQQCVDDFHGVYAGDASTCDDAPCKGACCSAEAQCEDGVTEAQCSRDSSAVFNGVGTQCSESACGGACCNDSQDTCALSSSKSECEVLSGSRWIGYGHGCDGAAACVQPGACCIDSSSVEGAPQHAAVCMISDGDSQCSSLGGKWHGKNSLCGSNEYGPDSICYVPTRQPTQAPSHAPSRSPTRSPTHSPTQQPTPEPTPEPTLEPTAATVTSSRVAAHRPRSALQSSSLALSEATAQSNHSAPLPGEGACCSVTDVCTHTNPIDCAAANGFFRGENSTCDDVDVCARCLPCILEEDETGYCPVRLYNSFASDSHRHVYDYHHYQHSHHYHSHHDSHTHHVHHRDDFCEDPQICTTNYGRCFFPSSQRADDPASSVRYCGGEETADMACSAELGNGRCAIGRCKPDAVLGSFGQYACVDLREFPCGCVCFDDSALSCGAARGIIFDDHNRNDVFEPPAEAPIEGATVGIWLDDSSFTLPVSTAPIAMRVSNERGEYVFNSLQAGMYRVVIVSLPPPFVVISSTPEARSVEITCPGLLHADTSDSDNDDDDGDGGATSLNFAQRNLVRAGGSIGTKESAAHLDLDNDFGVGASFTVSGRVAIDTNDDNIAQSNETGVGHAQIAALLLPTRHKIATAVSSTVDGSFAFEGLPEGTYDFEKSNPPGFRSAGDSAPPDDDTVPNIVVSYASGNITSGIDFFVEPDSDATDYSHCHNILTWWLYGECHEHVWNDHITTALLSFLLLFGFCICLILCVALCVFSGAFIRRRAPKPRKRAKRREDDGDDDDEDGDGEEDGDDEKFERGNQEERDRAMPLNAASGQLKKRVNTKPRNAKVVVETKRSALDGIL